MRWMNREHHVDGNHRRARNFERDRALQALRNAALILVFGFVMLGLAFASAWQQ